MRVTIVNVKSIGRTRLGGNRWQVRYLVGASPTVSTIRPHTQAAHQTYLGMAGEFDIEINGRNQIIDLKKV